MKTNRILPILLALAAAALACNLPGQEEPEPTEIPTLPPTIAVPTEQAEEAAQPACLVGSWQIVDLSAYILAAVPQEMMDEYNLSYEGNSGSVTLDFSPEGDFTLDASEFQVDFEASMAILSLPVTARVDGSASGTYQVDGSTVTTEDVDTSGLSASAEAAGQEVLEESQIIQAMPMLEPPYNRADFVCTGDSMQLEIHDYPGDVPPLVFQRVE